MFDIPNMINPRQYSFYSFNDQIYRDFMMSVLSKLEPIQVPKKTVIFNELDETQEIYFFMKGTYEIGYSINLENKFALKYQHNVIGMYAVTFFKRSQFIYRTCKTCSGYFIRRFNWREILKDNDKHLCDEFKDQLAKEYEVKIMNKMNLKKSIELTRLSLRADFESHKFNSGHNDEGILKSGLRQQK
jgi:hypothetical protein